VVRKLPSAVAVISQGALLMALSLGHSAHSADGMSVSLKSGEFYFRHDGRQTFLLGRNPTGWQVGQFEPLLEWAGESGERIVRIQVTSGFKHSAPAGELNEEWAARWDRVFDMAAGDGLYVLPVLGVWADWNDGSKGERWHFWDRNDFNAALGGPAGSPTELLQDTPCRRLWLQWVGKLVGRWQGRPNILGWEIFSELNLVTGSSEVAVSEFVDRAASTIRAADSRDRPITASLAGMRDWPALYGSDSLDFLAVHPYASHPRYQGNLDDMILASVRRLRGQYGKPVFIGESGLDARGIKDTLVVAPRAHMGIKHAIWASVVSGAMNGRMLWWEDGYDQYSRLDVRTRYRHASRPVARFVEGVDFAGFRPIEASPTDGMTGAALGHEGLVLGWFRDVQCAPPDWPVRPVEGEAVILTVPGAEGEWRVQFFDTDSSEALATRTVRREGAGVRVPMPSFEGSMAFKMSAGPQS